MAQGDIKTFGAYNLAAAATFDIQPVSSEGYVITSIEIEVGKSGAEIYRTSDGTHFTKVEAPTQSEMNLLYHCTNTFWLRVKNIDAGAAGIYCHGRQII